MSDAKQVIAEVIRSHRPSMLRCYPMKCRCGSEYTDFHVHLAEMVDAALGGLTRETNTRTGIPGVNPDDLPNKSRWVTDWTPA